MTNLLDHVQPGPVLDVHELPRSASRQEWFSITRNIVAGTIANLAERFDAAELSLVEEHFIAAGPS